MITIRNLAVSYHEKQVLFVKDLTFARGEIISVIGQNGAGKSTLEKSLSRLTQYKGDILIDRKDLKELTERKRAERIVYLPQSQHSPAMSVKTLVSHGRFPHLGYSHILKEKDEKIIAEAMEATHVARLQERFLDELSLGERQRAYLAMIIATQSDYLLLDEPTTYLDLGSTMELMEILLNLKKQNKGIMMVVHDLPFAFTIRDRLILLDHGEVKKIGTPAEMLEDQNVLYASFHVGIKKINDASLLYQYVIVK